MPTIHPSWLTEPQFTQLQWILEDQHEEEDYGEIVLLDEPEEEEVDRFSEAYYTLPLGRRIGDDGTIF